MKLIDDHEENELDTLGSLTCTGVSIEHTHGDKQIREYMGLSGDAGKLPKYKDLATGSLFFAIDTGDVYMYDATNQNWILQ